MPNANSRANAHRQPILVDTDETDTQELDSDSEDGGMQLDPPDRTVELQIASREMELDIAQDNDRPARRQGKPLTPFPPNHLPSTPLQRYPRHQPIPIPADKRCEHNSPK